MSDDDMPSIDQESGNRKSVTKIDGVLFIVCENRFEVLAADGCEINEQRAVQMLREWNGERKKKLRATGDLSG